MSKLTKINQLKKNIYVYIFYILQFKIASTKNSFPRVKQKRIPI